MKQRRTYFLEILLITAAIGFIGRVSPALAYPEMVRHGYVNCTSCHISPSGGGVLTEYGRELSKESLSLSSREGEQAFAYGLIKPPSWLTMGGDLRTVYVYKDTAFATEGRTILMQADLEAAAQLDKMKLVAAVGHQDPRPESSRFTDHLISRKHYVTYSFSDEWTARAGRFMPAYGINTPDHIISIKRGLGFDQGQETYNLEGSYISEKVNLYATAILGRLDNPDLQKEKGVAFSASAPWVFDHSKWGVSDYFGLSPRGSRHVFGPFVILALSDRVSFLSELDFQRQALAPRSQTTFGALNYQKLSYEWTQGVWAFLTQEWSRLDFAKETTLSTAYGAGVQFFPRPHLEVSASWQIQKILAVSPETSQLAWFLFHFYL